MNVKKTLLYILVNRRHLFYVPLVGLSTMEYQQFGDLLKPIGGCYMQRGRQVQLAEQIYNGIC